MDTAPQVEVLRLHCEHLRTLIDQVLSEIITIKRAFAIKANPSSVSMIAPLNALETQNEHLAAETVRFQSFLRSLEPLGTHASEAAGESSLSSPPPTVIPQRGRYKIVCTQDGKEPEIRLYGEYADVAKRTFPNNQHALLVHEYLSGRARGRRWESLPPRYEIVSADV